MMNFSRTGRSSFRATDRIHSTLQKAVKDGNVLEKIKAFEMQAAAAQAESAMKLGGLNHRMQTVTSSLQSAAYRTLSPAVVHPIQHPVTPIPIHQQQQQPVRSGRDHHVHPVQHRRDASHGPMVGHGPRKGAHVLEPAHGDIILKRRTPSQRTAPDEDYSITAISSLAVTNSKSHQHHHHHHQEQQRSRQQQQQQHHRTNGSRSRHRQEMIYDKRAPSNHEHTSHKHQQKQKRTTPPLSKSSARRRWLKGRKETPTETPIPSEKQELTPVKSNKGNKNKKKPVEPEKGNRSKKGSTSDVKRKSLSDNNRVYGVPNPESNEPIKLESSSPPPPPKLDEKVESDPEKDNTNTYMAPKAIEPDPNRECEHTIQRRTSKSQHQHKLSSTDGEILNKMTDSIDPNDDEVFLTDSSLKPLSNITRHQSIVHLSRSDSRHFQRHTSQCSPEELSSNTRRYQRSTENLLKKKSLPLTIITRKTKLNPDEQNVYETPHSEHVQTSSCHSHTLKKQRPFHTITTSGGNNNKQISKQILHAIMNSMNNTQEQQPSVTRTSSVYDEFFENGPLTNPEDTLANITT